MNTGNAPTIEEQIAGVKYIADTDSALGNKYWSSVLASLERLKRLDSQPVPEQWVKCSERLPTESDCDKKGRLLVVEKDIDGTLFAAAAPLPVVLGYKEWGISKWQPLPPLPKEGE